MVLDFLINKLHIFGLISLPVNFIFLVGAWFFLLGLFGALFSFERIVIYFMCIELMWLGISLGFLGSYILNGSPSSLVFAIVVLAIAAAETAIGLALLINFYRVNKNINLRSLSNLRG